MRKYTITLQVTVNQAGLKFIVYPVIERTTRNADKAMVERAVENRYAREHGSLVRVKAVRTSVELIKEVA